MKLWPHKIPAQGRRIVRHIEHRGQQLSKESIATDLQTSCGLQTSSFLCLSHSLWTLRSLPSLFWLCACIGHPHSPKLGFCTGARLQWLKTPLLSVWTETWQTHLQGYKLRFKLKYPKVISVHSGTEVLHGNTKSETKTASVKAICQYSFSFLPRWRRRHDSVF